MKNKVENGTGIAGAVLGVIGGALMFIPEVKKIVSYILFGVSAVCTVGVVITKTIKFFKKKKKNEKAKKSDKNETIEADEIC